MANDSEFQEKIRQIGKLIAEFDELPDNATKTASRELVQLLMDTHGAGLERIMEVIFESGDRGSGDRSTDILDRLGQDPIVGSLLILYSLHPDCLETRICKAMERLRPRLRKLGCGAELFAITEGAVQIRIVMEGHACGSTVRDLRALVEEVIYEMAPDVSSLTITGLETPSSSGFIAVESLTGTRAAATAAPSVRPEDGN